MRQLQEAITSPSGDIKSSAINRLLFEYPPPMNLTIFGDSPAQKQSTTTPSPTTTLKSKQRKSTDDLFDLSGDDESPAPTQPSKKPKLAQTTLSESSSKKDFSSKPHSSLAACKDVSNQLVFIQLLALGITQAHVGCRNSCSSSLCPLGFY